MVPHIQSLLILSLISGLPLSVAGCSGGSASQDDVASTESAYESGLKCFEQGDFSGAETQLTTAVASGTLQPDLTESALRTLARARIAQGKLTEAEETLKQLQAGAMEQDQFLLVTAELELKKGNRDAAKRAVQQARAVNSKLAIPASLKGL